MPVYLDANASEPVRPQALEALKEAIELGGNPSSIHTKGRKAYGLLENARKEISGKCGYDPDGCIFTSGASEANALALHRLDHASNRYSLYCIGSTDHPSLWNFIQSPDSIYPGAKVLSIKVDQNGRYDFAFLKKQITLKREEFNEAETGRLFSALICISAANSESGISSNLYEALDLCQEMHLDLHIDATQAAGRGWLPSKELAAYASLSLSGHKMGGIQGAGVLLLPPQAKVSPVIPGQGQELGRRKGTPPLPAIVAMSSAFKESSTQDWGRMKKLRDKLEDALEKVGAIIIGKGCERIPNTVYVALKGISAQVQLMRLDMQGFCVSAGSACSSGKTENSHVLEAMGYKDVSDSAVRISLPWNVSEEDVDSFIKAYTEMVERLREQ